MKDSLNSLERLIISHQNKYEAGNPTIADPTFDLLVEKLKTEKPDSKVLHLIGQKPVSGETVRHKSPMLSQDKALTNEALLQSLASISNEANDDTFVASSKLDGMAGSLHYKEGVLYMACTRGDGEVGQIITSKAMYIVPTSINNSDFSCEVRGEFVISAEAFEKVNSLIAEPFKTQRNAVVGIFNEDSFNLDKLECIDFVAYDIMPDGNGIFYNEWFENEDTYSSILDFLRASGFKVPLYYIATTKTAESILDYFFDYKDSAEYPVDGVVFRLNDNNTYLELGTTAHHPRGAVAWKYPAQGAVVEIKDIIWSVGTADISPVAVFNKVLIDEAEIEKVSLKSVSNMIELGCSIGSNIMVVRSGGVIPWAKETISEPLSKTQILSSVPEYCPICGFAIQLTPDYAHLTCTNDSCKGKFARKLEIFAKMLDRKNFGPANCLKIAEHIDSFDQLFWLTDEPNSNILHAEFNGGKMVDILQAEISSVKEVPLAKFLASLCIPRLGYNTAVVLANQYKTLETILSLTPEDLILDLDRFGEDSAQTLVNGLNDARDLIKRLLEYIKVVDEVTHKVTSATFAGMNICITGPLSVQREIWKQKIEAAGGKVTDSVSKNTTCLICNKASSSSKYRNALKYGTPIYTEQWLVEKIS